MNSLWVKIKKAQQVIKRDGWLNGGRRIITGFFALFHWVGEGEILFISSGVGDSARYRSYHTAEELKLKGFSCKVVVQDIPRLKKYVNKFEVFIFQRTTYTKNVAKMIKEIKRQQKTIIFETDDLVYDPWYLKYMHYYNQISESERKIYQQGIGKEIVEDEYVEVATTTTKYLAKKLKEKGKKVFIVSNKLSLKDLEFAKRARREKRKDNHEVRLGYFSGTISHNKDFAVITQVLVKIMEKYKRVKLFLVGPLDVENELVRKFKNRIVQLPYVMRKKHFANIAKCDINLAPLEYDNPFCEAKSELKFFEAGIVKVPTVAVNNQTYKDAIIDGVDGFIAGNEQVWVEKLSQLIENKDLRRQMGNEAYQKIVKYYTTKNAQNIKYYNYLRRHLSKKIKTKI